MNTPTPMTQREAYEALLKLSQERGWAATHTVLSEDGFDERDDTDYLALLSHYSMQRSCK